MRPLTGSEAFQARSRKPSLAEPPVSLTDARSGSPVTFFLRRGSQGSESTRPADVIRGQDASPLQSLADTLDSLSESTSTLVAKHDTEDTSRSPRRRSTLKANGSTISQRSASVKGHIQTSQEGCLTPLLIPSVTSSPPSSPKSTSARSTRPSEPESTAEETGSQAILSSGDEERPSQQLAESAPQLIMPSIKMPSRRPFTERGKRIGNFKILIAGSKGAGKTSLIKSIVQTCEDIVHIDPLPVASSSIVKVSSNGKQALHATKRAPISEISASTKSYPSWWSDVEDSKAVRKRRSMGDAVLDRNLCFVDTDGRDDCHQISNYMVLQLQKALRPPATTNGDFAALLSGTGGPQVDIVLYLISKDSMEADIANMTALSELSNVIPLISKADLLSAEEIDSIKLETTKQFDTVILPRLPAFDTHWPEKETREIFAPYTISSAIGPDHETMDASLLMSPDYVQPLMPSELGILIQQIFETDVMSYLRHLAAKKLIAWEGHHQSQSGYPSQTTPSPPPSSSPQSSSSLASPPLPYSFSNSGILIPFSSDLLSLTPSSTSQAMTRLAEHTHQEERLAQVRLTKWASDLQTSLQRERERFEQLAQGERAIWLVEKMGHEARNGRLSARDHSGALLVRGDLAQEPARGWTCSSSSSSSSSTKYATRDPLGLLGWSDCIKTRGWIALQVFGGFGMIGGLAFWLARAWGMTNAVTVWAQGCGWNFRGVGCGAVEPGFV